MIDIVTVVFQDELSVLKLQAQSIDLYCQDIGVQNIHVIVNDDPSVMSQIDFNWWGSMSHLVKLTHRDYFDCTFVENGWVSQQALKLLGAAMCENPWSMILDAKTIFARPLLLSELFDQKNRLNVGTLQIYSVFEPSRKIINQLFNIDLQLQAGPGGVPFFFHVQPVREMIKDIELRVGEKFAEWFQAQGMLTEFMLYSGWLQYCCGLDSYYSKRNKFSIINLCHSEVAMADIKLANMHQSQVLTVSVHRRAWDQFSAEQKQTYRDMLISKGISSAQEYV
jgi:hypothetical protein